MLHFWWNILLLQNSIIFSFLDKKYNGNWIGNWNWLNFHHTSFQSLGPLRKVQIQYDLSSDLVWF